MFRFRAPDDIGHEFRLTVELEESGTRRPQRAQIIGKLLGIEPAGYRFEVLDPWLDEDSGRPWYDEARSPTPAGGMLIVEQQILSAEPI